MAHFIYQDRFNGYTAPAESRIEAQEIAGQFPKSHKVGVLRDAAGERFWVIAQMASLSQVTGERNEAGEARLRRFVNKARKLGHTVAE